MIYTFIEPENDYGSNQVIGTPLSFINSQLEITGHNNTIIFGDRFKGKDLHINVVGNNATIVFGPDCDIRANINLYDHSMIMIGKKFRTTKIVELTAFNNTAIMIGDNCLFSNVVVETTDFYSMLSIDNNNEINNNADITIGNRVWCSRDVIIEKGTSLGNHVVVGARSVVNATFGNNSVIAGNPAKLVKENIIWDECTELKEFPFENLM